ncbi:DUF2064 domain-containing protein [Bizionia gelidisalsuginis]|uniref:DUF2064 domain-containing protein n=2 Tax=Bizionia TaxID=283785 RepID=A0A8H2QKD3_9FLAO|nr:MULTISPECIES: DUF2064 domain-containing protein [Bizionia]TYB78122.1 DUF2064 domain-containing protein [Bizionia saleffrena]TYC12114.1 DUF2064 domain-containing protein [Bizionia gelidisalsuginis]
MKNKDIALLIFANSVPTEAERKPFKSAVSLFSILNKQVESKVINTGIPYFIISEKEQIGNSFGSRFTNAIQSVFNKGFRNIITIGNDTPHLKTAHLNETIAKLKTNDLVLGPSQDGGFYLMGLSKHIFNDKAFKKLPWQTAALTTTFLKLASEKNITFDLLERLYDIDTSQDIKAIINSFKSLSKTLKQFLLNSINTDEQTTLQRHLPFPSVSLSSYFNKGSPLYLE